ncbi:hypothetical protein B0F90DRAFT_1128079 [Multifurca ochricompacta]|uniref:Uncharacterized protein n=1 Tax=Multifurca ochricompacta TaxID=376703 RepID=A0AAD4QII9_9AGAM|nr:hypothetical protein B0F90DRAFT_1128079 [Multifurca ochricompacta]
MVLGLNKLGLRWMVEVLLPTLLHISVFLFLTGFVIYLFSFHHLVAKVVVGCVGACALLYLSFSSSPIIFPQSTYFTPLTKLIRVFSMGVILLVLAVCYWTSLCWRFKAAYSIRDLFRKYYQRIRAGMTKDVEEMAVDQSLSLGLYTSVVNRTFRFLEGDQDMEQFLSSIPGFYDSTRVGEEAARVFDELNSKELPGLIISFMSSTLSSHLLKNDEKKTRIAICTRAINADPVLLRLTFRQTLEAMELETFRNIHFVQFALSHSDNLDYLTRDCARCIVAVAINCAHDYRGDWAKVVQRHLNLSDIDLNYFLHNVDSMRLYSLIHLIWQLKASRLRDSDQFEPGKVWYKALAEARKLNIANVVPEMRREFCALWNELVKVTEVLAGQTPSLGMSQPNARHILSLLCDVYTPLHAGTPCELGAPPQPGHPYPRCIIPTPH